MAGPKRYEAIIWPTTADRQRELEMLHASGETPWSTSRVDLPGARSHVMATNPPEAMRHLRDKYGDKVIISTWDEQDVRDPRG